METDEGCVGRVLRGKEREEERGEEERAEKRGEERGEQAAAAAASAGRQITKDGNHRGASGSRPTRHSLQPPTATPLLRTRSEPHTAGATSAKQAVPQRGRAALRGRRAAAAFASRRGRVRRHKTVVSAMCSQQVDSVIWAGREYQPARADPPNVAGAPAGTIPPGRGRARVRSRSGKHSRAVPGRLGVCARNVGRAFALKPTLRHAAPLKASGGCGRAFTSDGWAIHSIQQE